MNNVTHTLQVLVEVRKTAERFGLSREAAERAARAAVGLYRQDGNHLRAANDGRRLARLMADRARGPETAA